MAASASTLSWLLTLASIATSGYAWLPLYGTELAHRVEPDRQALHLHTVTAPYQWALTNWKALWALASFLADLMSWAASGKCVLSWRLVDVA
eukprot:2442096-Amphidinium_carterae.1